MSVGRAIILGLGGFFSGAGMMSFIILGRLFYGLSKYEKALKEEAESNSNDDTNS